MSTQEFCILNDFYIICIVFFSSDLISLHSVAFCASFTQKNIYITSIENIHIVKDRWIRVRTQKFHPKNTYSTYECCSTTFFVLSMHFITEFLLNDSFRSFSFCVVIYVILCVLDSFLLFFDGFASRDHFENQK